MEEENFKYMIVSYCFDSYENVKEYDGWSGVSIYGVIRFFFI